MLSERLFEDILVKYPELIEDRLKFLGRQVTHFGKRIDILFEDRFKEKLIIELKKDNLDRNALSQIMEYEGYILSEKDPSARVMIIANRIPLNPKKAMDHHGIEYKEITYKYLMEFLEQKDEQLLNEIAVPKSEDKKNNTVLKTGTMLTEISGDELHQSVINFRNRIKAELFFTGKRTLSFPGGEKGNGDNYELQTKYGLLSIIVVADDSHINRYMHFITLNQENSQTASDTEINIPKIHDSRVSALFAENQGHRYICNRGKCTVYMRALKMSVVLDHFAEKYGNVVQIQENEKQNSVIRIADLESPMLFEQIAQFTNQIKTFKQQFRNL